MSDDLVKRLECYADLNDAVYHPWVYKECADRIKDLNFQISVIQGAAAHAQKSYEEHLAVYRQKLEEKPPIWHDDIQSLQERDAIMTDRIEKLEEENGVLFAANVRLNSRADLDCDHYRDRIKKLEAALREITALGFWDGDRAMDIARKALEGKDD